MYISAWLGTGRSLPKPDDIVKNWGKLSGTPVHWQKFNKTEQNLRTFFQNWILKIVWSRATFVEIARSWRKLLNAADICGNLKKIGIGKKGSVHMHSAFTCADQVYSTFSGEHEKSIKNTENWLEMLIIAES